MLIFWTERLVFLANTKCGSTSIAMALESLAHVSIQRPAALKHLTAAQYHRHLAPLLTSVAGGAFTTVALMRDPFDWLGSWYRSRRGEAGQGEADQSTAGPDGAGHGAVEQGAAGLTFPAFAEAFLDPAPPPWARIVTQAEFLADDAGQPLVDRIFPYGQIDRLVHFLEERLGCEILLPHANVSPAGEVTADAALRQRLAERLDTDNRLYRSVIGGSV